MVPPQASLILLTDGLTILDDSKGFLTMFLWMSPDRNSETLTRNMALRAILGREQKEI